jgi:NitT/TauT family transport system substrate-binding protein
MVEQQFNRRTLLRTAGASLAGFTVLGGLAACGGDESAAGSGSSNASKSYSGNMAIALLLLDEMAAGLHVALDKGYFTDRQLTLKPVNVLQPPDVARAVVSNMPLGALSGMGALTAFDAGLKDLRIIGTSIAASTIVFLVKPDSPVKSFADLKGKKVGVSVPGSLTTAFGTLAAKKAGLDPKKDLDLVNVKGDYTTSLLEGVVDAAWSSPPLSTQLIKQGKARVLLQTSDLEPKFITGVYVSSQKFIDSNRQIVKNWLAALNEAADLIKSDTKAAAESWAKRIKIDPAIAEAALDEYKDRWIMAHDMEAFQAMVRVGMDNGVIKDPNILDKVLGDPDLYA